VGFILFFVAIENGEIGCIALHFVVM